MRLSASISYARGRKDAALRAALRHTSCIPEDSGVQRGQTDVVIAACSAGQGLEAWLSVPLDLIALRQGTALSKIGFDGVNWREFKSGEQDVRPAMWLVAQIRRQPRTLATLPTRSKDVVGHLSHFSSPATSQSDGGGIEVSMTSKHRGPVWLPDFSRLA